jgi:hypothetical protein
MQSLHTTELDMAKPAKASDIEVVLSDMAWAIYSTHHTVLLTRCSNSWTRNAL